MENQSTTKISNDFVTVFFTEKQQIKKISGITKHIKEFLGTLKELGLIALPHDFFLRKHYTELLAENEDLIKENDNLEVSLSEKTQAYKDLQELYRQKIHENNKLVEDNLELKTKVFFEKNIGDKCLEFFRGIADRKERYEYLPKVKEIENERKEFVAKEPERRKATRAEMKELQNKKAS